MGNVKIKNPIEEYYITYRVAFSHDINFTSVHDRLQKLLKSRALYCALDSQMTFAKYEENKPYQKQFPVNFDSVKATDLNIVKENEHIEEFEKHFFKSTMYRFKLKNQILQKVKYLNELSAMMQSIRISFEHIDIYLRPIIRIFDGSIMIDFRINSDNYFRDYDDFTNAFSELFEEPIKDVKLKSALYNEFFQNVPVCNEDMISAPKGWVETLKDLALKIVELFVDKTIGWMARTTYYLKIKHCNQKMALPLLYSYRTDKGLLRKKNTESLVDYDEFNSSCFYVSRGASVTFCDSEYAYLNYNLADVIDEEILNLMTQIYKINKVITENLSYAELLKENEKILNIKTMYAIKYDKVSSFRKIIDDVWTESKADLIIEQIQELINLKIDKMEYEKEKQINTIQYYFSIITVLLSCTPLYEYIILPSLSMLFNRSIDSFGPGWKLAFFLISLGILGVFLLIKVIKRKKKKKKDNINRNI